MIRKTKNISVIVLAIALFSACGSKKLIQGPLQNIRVDLDYELTSPVYEENPDKTVYLNFIDNSNMEYFTVVKGSSTWILPFILYNYWRKKSYFILGENTLTQLYREFLMDALLAECNRSACFNLKTADDTFADDAYSLDVRIIHNETQSGIQETNTIFVPFLLIDQDIIDFQHTSYRVLATSSDLKIAVSCKKGEQILWKKDYAASENLKDKSLGNDLFLAKEACVHNMAECLSFATKQVVTEISRDLNIVLSAQ